MRHARTREAVERLCATELDDRVLRRRVVEQLRTAVDFDWYGWVVTDPSTTVGSSRATDLADDTALPAVVAARYRSPIGRWTVLRPGHVVTHATQDGPDGDPWVEVLRERGTSEVLSLVLADAYGCWAHLDLGRGSGGFEREDIGLLTGLTAPLTRAVRRSVGVTVDAAREPLAQGEGTVLLLPPDLVPPASAAGPDLPAAVPAAAVEVAAQLLAVEDGVDDHVPATRLRLPGAGWWALRAERAHDRAGPVAVTVEPATVEQRADLFARAHGLSRRESEVLLGLVGGAGTADLAASLGMSQHTVQVHLKSVFAKTGLRSRPSLLARVGGPTPPATIDLRQHEARDASSRGTGPDH